MAQILRDAGLSDLVESGEVECLARGFEFTEGPLWCPDGSLLFQDNKAERTYRLDPDRSVHVLREQTGAANGQTFGPDGRIVFCEQNGRRVSRMNRDGTGVETLAETWSGAAAQQPQRHRLPVRRDRLLHRPALRRQAGRPGAAFPGGLLARPPARGGGAGGLEPQLLLDDFEKPNGLAFSPDERILYICDTARYHIRAFDVEPSGSLRVGSGRVFARMDPETPGGPDGVKVDRDGRVYVGGRPGRLGLRARRPPARHHRPARHGRRTWPGATATPAAWP